jgi:hypothetical protein
MYAPLYRFQRSTRWNDTRSASLYIYIILFVAGADMDACISSRIDDKPPQKKTVKLPWLLPTNRIAHARECSLLVTVIAFSRFVIGRVVTGITR